MLLLFQQRIWKYFCSCTFYCFINLSFSSLLCSSLLSGNVVAVVKANLFERHLPSQLLFPKTKPTDKIEVCFLERERERERERRNLTLQESIWETHKKRKIWKKTFLKTRIGDRSLWISLGAKAYIQLQTNTSREGQTGKGLLHTIFRDLSNGAPASTDSHALGMT